MSYIYIYIYIYDISNLRVKVVHFVVFQDVCSDLVYFELMYKVCESFTFFTAVWLSFPIPVGYDSASLGKYPVTRRRIAVQSLK